MTITQLLAAVQADVTQLQTDLNALATALQGLDISTLQTTLADLASRPCRPRRLLCPPLVNPSPPAQQPQS